MLLPTLTPIGGNPMALAKVEKKFLKGSPKKRVSTDAITRAYFGR